MLSSILVGFSIAVFLLMHHHLLALTDAALAEELADFAGDLARCDSLKTVRAELGLRYRTHEGYEFQVTTAAGTVLFASDGLGPGGLPVPRPRPGGAPAGRASLNIDRLGYGRLAWKTVPGPGGHLGIAVAVSLAPINRERSC